MEELEGAGLVPETEDAETWLANFRERLELWLAAMPMQASR